MAEFKEGDRVTIVRSFRPEIVGSTAIVVAPRGGSWLVKLEPRFSQYHDSRMGRIMRPDYLTLELTPFESRVQEYIRKELHDG